MSDILYTGILLPEEVKLGFEKSFPDYFELGNVFCHHVTLNYLPDSEVIEATEFGKEVLVEFTKVYKNDNLAVSVCTFDGEKRYKVEHPHMTISTAKNVLPVESKYLLEKIRKVGFRNLPYVEIPECHVWYHETYPSFVGKIVGFDQNNQVIRS
jgi:hypothetical protein